MQVELKNTTKKLCIIGDPVLHSRSPILQNAMLSALGLDYVYLCQRVSRGETAEWLRCAKFAGYAGFNATMPHKEALVSLLDELDPLSAKCGAVNTVSIRDGKAYGFNTDGGGFLRALDELGIDPAGKRVLLLGSGGAARAVSAALCMAGAKVTVCNRTVEKAEALCKMYPEAMTPAGFSTEELGWEAGKADILVNCTSLGMAGTESQFDDFSFLEALPQGAAVCDAIYAPAQTELLRRAAGLGHPTMNGMGMLLHQAVLALEHFAGEKIDQGAALAAARKALEDSLQ